MRMFRKLKIIPGIILGFIKNGGTASVLYILLVLVKSFIPLIQTVSVTNIVRNLNNNRFYLWLLMIIMCLLYSDLHYKVIGYLEESIKYRFSRRIGNTLLDVACDIPYIRFENSETYNKISRASDGANISFAAFKHTLTVVERIIEIFSLEIYLIRIAPGAAAVVSMILLLGIFVCGKTADLSWKSKIGTTELEREIDYTFETLVAHENISELKLFRSYVPLRDKYLRKVNELFQIQRKTTLKNMILQNISTVCLALAGTGILFVNMNALIHRQISASLFAGIMVSLLNMMDSISIFNVNYSNFTKALFHYENLQEMIRFGHEDILDGDSRISSDKNEYAVSIRNVCFSYDKGLPMVLNQVSFDVHRGECIVLVGENGCGKSTLIKLILGLYPPRLGNIYVMGAPAGDLLNTPQPEIAAVFQDCIKYNLSVREILSADRAIAEEKLLQVLKAVGLYEKIASLPYGLDTVLGKTFVNATDLSEGQWQKLNIAKALLSDAGILIFDEPTASLDPMAEAAFYDEIVKLKENKTIMIVSHRLGIVSVANRIVMMEQGRVIGTGTHDALMKQCSAYARMYHNQAKWYEEEKKEPKVQKEQDR